MLQPGKPYSEFRQSVEGEQAKPVDNSQRKVRSSSLNPEKLKQFLIQSQRVAEN